MRHRRPRKFRYRSNDRNHHQQRVNGTDVTRLGSNSYSNGRRNNFHSRQSAEKLLEKYNTLAKEALSSGDKILSENYFQHADHFIRIIEEKNIIQNQKKEQVTTSSYSSEQVLEENIENKKINDQEIKEIKEKKE